MKALKKFAAVLTCAVLSAAMLTGCSDKTENEEIAVPILEQQDTAFNTVKAEITEISEKYYSKCSYDYPYTTSLKFAVSGQVETVNVSSGDTVTKGQLLCTLNDDEVEEQIEEKQIYLNQAKETLETLTAEGTDQNQIELAQLELDIQQLEYDHLVESLEDYKIYSTFDGEITITAGTYDKDGKFVEELQPYMQVSEGEEFGYAVDKSEQYLVCDVYTELNNVNFGTKVELTQGSFSSTGTVTDIIESDGGEYSPNVYIITPDNEDDLFDFGDISACFSVYSRLDTVVVPQNAVVTVGDRTYVNLLMDGVKVEQDVETGITDGENIEITSGLSGGEDVIINKTDSDS